MKQNQQHKTKKINTVQVTRKVEKEITYTKLVDEKMNVLFEELTEDDISTLDHEEAKAVAVAFRKLYLEYKSIATDQIELLKFVSPEPPLSIPSTKQDKTSKDKVDTNTQRESKEAVTEHSRNGGEGGSNDELIGNKVGSTSKYHYVYFDRTQQCYRTTHTNIKYKTEIEAALASDIWLEQTGDKKRPKNADEFKEVKEAYDEH